MDVQRFNLKRKEVPVELEDANGNVSSYTIREMTGLQLEEYYDDNLQRMDFVDGKMQRLKKFKGMYSALLARCLYDDANRLVPLDVIESYSSTVQRNLFELAQQVNEMSEDEEDESKNE